MLHWPDCRNVRDVGGLPTTDGGRIREGALVRADDLAHLTDEGLAACRAAGVSRVIDLRGSVEIAELPGPFADDPAYRWLPLIDEEAERLRDLAAETTTLATYCGSVGRNARNIVALIQSSIEPESWNARGGAGTITFNEATLSIVVRNSAEVHLMLKGGSLGK